MLDSASSRHDRRSFLERAARVAGFAAVLPAVQLLGQDARAVPKFPAELAGHQTWAETWAAALGVLAGNVRAVPAYKEPVLFEGSTYQGAWQECGPHESLVYASLAKYVAPVEGKPDPVRVARNTHMAFFSLQREDGQLPAAVKMSDVGFAQIQMVVPIVATAWDLAQMAKDEEFLATAYAACGKWDAWLRRYRDTRKTGLVEAFCTYDTGQDNSPRWKGIPNRCADGDARKTAVAPGMPRLCPDLSATVYGGRVALASMAKALGKKSGEARWLADAETIRRLIVDKLYSAEDASFFDVDTEGKFVKVRSVANSRVLGEHVLQLSNAKDKAIFEAVWTRQLHNPKAFWAKYPLTSIAQDDPAFVRPIPRNSWGGASQALTALRAPRWMTHYGKEAELEVLMRQWCEAILRHGEFRQQMDPETGEFTQPDPGGYSPAALVFLEFARRLSRTV